MIRRTRRPKEIPFSFDSFLDVVANIVGIIIRLILVVWVGARSYNTIKPMILPHRPPESITVPATETVLPDDPLQNELTRNRLELDQIKAKLLEQLRDLQITEGQEREAEVQINLLADRARQLDEEKSGVERAVLDKRHMIEGAGLTVAALQERRQKLTEEIRKVEKLPPVKKVLRYHTPVSQTVKTDEFFFECKEGRVTFIDIASLQTLAENDIQNQLEELQKNRSLVGATASEGAFRVRYAVKFTSIPGVRSEVRSDLVVEPVLPVRGETAEVAMNSGSQFRQVVDRLKPDLAAVTFWVYPDSFSVYRQLRDYLYEKDIVVAGRPLPMTNLITLSSHTGSASRGQ